MKLETEKLRIVAAFLLSIVFTLMIIYAGIYGKKHSSSDILVNIDGKTMTLKEAIEGDYLRVNASAPTSSGTTSVSFGHNPDEIWVSVDGNEMTLADAIASNNLCGSTPKTKPRTLCR